MNSFLAFNIISAERVVTRRLAPAYLPYISRFCCWPPPHAKLGEMVGVGGVSFSRLRPCIALGMHTNWPTKGFVAVLFFKRRFVVIYRRRIRLDSLRHSLHTHFPDLESQ